MQPSLFSSVRTGLAQLPRSVSPHLASPTSPSSVRSLSPSRSAHIRSRSSSPSPRRFASVLAYHATPPPQGYGKSNQRLASEENQSPERSDDHGERLFRDKSPGRIAVRKLEESWRRFELESASTPTPPSATASSIQQSTPHGPRPFSPLSKPPYTELIECNSFRSTTTKMNPDAESLSRSSPPTESPVPGRDPLGRRSADKDHSKNDKKEMGRTSASSSSSSTSNSSSEKTLSDKATLPSAEATAAAPHPLQHTNHTNYSSDHGISTTFLASDEARQILDLPPLLGRDPNTIHQVLPVSHQFMAQQPSQPRPVQAHAQQTSQMLSQLDVQAEATAKAMTERYAAKNLNMTETEAHRMVQVMAAEIVALHEEREQMQMQMQEAKQEMLEAAKLLRMRAIESEMKDMSQSGTAKTKARNDDDDHYRRQDQEQDQQGQTSGQKQKGFDRGLYDKDEWHD